MICHKCGTVLDADARFCAECGAPQGTSGETAVLAPAEPAIVAPAEPVVASPVVPVVKPAYETEGTCPFCISPLRKGTKFCNTCGRPVVPINTQFAEAPKKKGGRGLLIGIAAGIFAILLLVGGYFVVRGMNRQSLYDQAVMLYDDGEYEEAAELFESLGDYKDSKKMAKRSNDRLKKEGKEDPTEEPTEESTEGSTEDTEPSQEVAVTQETEIAATEAPEPTEVESTEIQETSAIRVQEAELVYALTDADVEHFYELLERSEALAMEGADQATLDAVTDELSAQFTYLDAQYSIAMILYYCDLNDEAASQLYLDASEIRNTASDAYMAMCRRVYVSDSPSKDYLFADWTEADLAELMAYTSEIMELEQRNSELEVQYQSLQDSGDLYDAMVPIYLEMVRNNNRIAQIYGYSDYYTYAYERVYQRDYAPERINEVRGFATSYLVPALDSAMVNFYESMGELNMWDSMKLSAFFYDSYDEDTYVQDYLNILPRNMGQDMFRMFDGDILLKGDVDGAMEGAFTASIGEDRQVCFFGPDYGDSLTVLHEVGHYYGGCHTLLDDIPLDLAEIQSQGNEWLFIAYADGILDPDVYETVLDYRMYSDLTTVFLALLVDEFEEQVYNAPNLDTMTGEDLDVIMEGVCARYGGLTYVNENITDIQSYWRMVVVDQPVYYISYGVSALSAMDMYFEAEVDFDSAVESYRTLVEELDPELGFLGNLEKAGLNTPFDEELYKSILAACS